MKKKISVVIPTYGRPALLRNCIEALGRQDMAHADYEVIVVSDGPDPKTREMLNSIVGSHLPVVQYITLAAHKGPAAARNAGFKAARAALVAFTDDDCLPSPQWVSSVYNSWWRLQYQPMVAFTGKVIVPLPETPTDYELNTAHLERAAFITANCACTKRALQKVGGFDERFTVAWREDSDLEFRLIENNVPILPVQDAVVVHPVRKAAWGISIKEQQKTMFNALLYKKFPSLFREKIQRYPAWNYYLIVAGFLMIIAGWVARESWISLTGTILYVGFTLAFIIKRLSRTSKEMRHVAEMTLTSIVIPFVSVYWTIYGAIKYRVLFY